MGTIVKNKQYSVQSIPKKLERTEKKTKQVRHLETYSEHGKFRHNYVSKLYLK